LAHKKQILVLTSTFPRWASDTEPTFVFDLSRNYVHKGFQVDVIAPHAYGSKSHEIIDGVNIFRYRYFFERLQTLTYHGGINANLKNNKFNYLLVPFFFLFQAVEIVRRLKNNQYDVIHSHWLIPQSFLCVFLCKFVLKNKTPIICTSHGGDLYSLNGGIMQRLKQWTANNCAHLCVVSEAMKKDCKEMELTTEDISVLPMGVDLQYLFIPSVNVERHDNRIIFVGRFVEKKGIDVLIDAISLVKDSVPLVEVILVGDGPLRDEVDSKIRELSLDDNVKICGGVSNSELPDLYSSANIAVIPSIIDPQGDREGLGLVTIEALGCGCAVIASALEPIKEVIEHGKSGLLFRPGSAEELAQHIMHLLEDKELSRALSSIGRAKVIETYDWQLVADNYCNLIYKMGTPK